MKYKVFTPQKYLVETFAGWFSNLSAAWFITGVAAINNLEVLTVNLACCTLSLLFALALNRVKNKYD